MLPSSSGGCLSSGDTMQAEKLDPDSFPENSELPVYTGLVGLMAPSAVRI